jgi:hypothetical protein
MRVFFHFATTITIASIQLTLDKRNNSVDTLFIAKSMRNRSDGAAPENAELAFSGDFAATGGTDFELFRFISS